MTQRRSLAWTELRVGLLVIASFVLLAVAMFFIGGEAGILTPKYSVTAFFSSANGLRSGAEVMLEGVTIGNVSTVRISTSPEPQRAVEVALRLDQRYRNIIRTDSNVSIGTIGLLGDKYVEISRGSEGGQVIEDGGVIQGTEVGDIRQIITGTNDFIANLEVLSDQVVRMTERVDRGEGTLGKLLTDTSIYDNIDQASYEASLLVRDARTGSGTVGLLMSDDQIYRNLESMMARVDTIVNRIENAEGAIGKFINDPAVYDRANDLLGQMQNIAARIERGEGTLGKLASDEQLYDDLRTTLGRVNTLVAAIENGEGTAGKFINDPTLYNSLNETSSEILKLLYDFRQDPKRFLTINFRLF